MRLKSARIQNFRSSRDLTVNFSALTRMVGPNGAGKSTVLRSLELFYASSVPTISREDFFNRETDREISIALTFDGLSQAERGRYGDKVMPDGTITVTRVFVEGGGKGNGKYYGSAFRAPEFAAVRAIQSARDRVAACRALSIDFPGLEQVTKADDVEPAFQAWETANPGRCVQDRDEGQFFGFQNVAKGRLDNSTMFVYVPAVRDAVGDVGEKGSAVAKLLDLVVRSAIEAKPAIKDFRERASQEFAQVMHPSNLTELDGLSDALSGTLKEFYALARVGLTWGEPQLLHLPLPSVELHLEEDGFRSGVARTGNGLQRALILTLLQHLALASLGATPSTAAGDGEARPELPGLVLAIEEPELYQHPTKQRHFVRVLERLTAGLVPGAVGQTQVIFTTHSPLFVSMERFEEVRLVRRFRPASDRPLESHVRTSCLDDVAAALSQATGGSGAPFTPASLKPRLHVIDASVSEGFFASVVVLVEGPSDRAALIATASLAGLDFEAEEIAIIPVGGKSNLDKPIAVLTSLGIPVFALWDCDLKNIKDNRDCNHRLLRLHGIAQADLLDAQSVVRETHGCFEHDLEATLSAEIGMERWERLLDELKVEFGVSSRKDSQKIPLLMSRLLRAASDEGTRSATLLAVVEAVRALRPILAPPPTLPPVESSEATKQNEELGV